MFLEEKKIAINAACYDNFASLTVIFYTGDNFDINSCGGCSLPSDDTQGFVAITFEVSCEPIPCEPKSVPSPPPASSSYSFSPVNRLHYVPQKVPIRSSRNPVQIRSARNIDELDCDDGIVTMQKDTGGNPMCEYSSQPFTIEQLDDSGSNELRFSFRNNWPAAMADIELLYDRGDGSGQQCQSLNSLSYGEMYPHVLEAACDPVTHTAEIEVYVSNTSISNSTARSQCGNSGPGLCSFVYRMPCSTDVICDGVRRLDTYDIETNSSVTHDFIPEKMITEPNEEDFEEDAPYCVHEDFPCKGDEEFMVHVCYYSSHSGYQTFCIPETDSDILRFNKNHHCGPCKGWNGEERTVQMM